MNAAEVETALGGAYTGLVVMQDQGGQGTVFKARAADGSSVALKVYNAAQVEERSEREVEALRQLTGTRLVRLHDAGTLRVAGEDLRFIATSFIEGRPLSDLIDATNPLGLAQAAPIIGDIAIALGELWSHKIVHRDVKPPNVMVESDGHAVLIDLGVARHLNQKALTSAGYTFGTSGYFAPETLAGRPITVKADIFALGILFQEVLKGRHPTYGQQHFLRYGGPSTSTLLTNLPPEIVKLIDSMVAREPFDRPSPKQVVDGLRAAGF